MSDPLLDTDLTDVSTKYPVLPAGAYEMAMTLVTEDSKDKKGRLVKVTLKTIYPTKDRDNKDVFAGHVVTDRISLTPTEKYPVDNIKKRLKQVCEAVFGEGYSGKFDIDLMNGKSVMVKLKIDSDTGGEFDDSNKVAKYIPKAA